MAISEYWVGEIPSEALRITIVDNNNEPIGLSQFARYGVRMLGTNNETLDMTGAVLLNQGLEAGTLTFRWPTDRSLFEAPGEYLLQIEVDGTNGTKEYTDAHTIRVRRFGGNR